MVQQLNPVTFIGGKVTLGHVRNADEDETEPTQAKEVKPVTPIDDGMAGSQAAQAGPQEPTDLNPLPPGQKKGPRPVPPSGEAKRQTPAD